MEISGKIAGVAFYKMNGKLIARSALRKGKAPKDDEAAKQQFFIAS